MQEKMSVSGYFTTVCPYCGQENPISTDAVWSSQNHFYTNMCDHDEGCGKSYAIKVTFEVTSNIEVATFNSEGANS